MCNYREDNRETLPRMLALPGLRVEIPALTLKAALDHLALAWQALEHHDREPDPAHLESLAKHLRAAQTQMMALAA